MVIVVRQLQRNNKVKQSMKELWEGVRQLPINDVRIGVGHLPREDLYIGLRQLQL